ncbi:hypothetical protein LMG27952_05703 [Paraburkholderia hiiakae]|uniref:Uncharacterized protein n=2 Tax=Paraburkholderia hiiakae TaxID=1081782 RepID=A0ABM8P2W5_9BURK|nr:hypothetical protein LMG27952_05703 [Paraburkholderia hiiakae]
MLTRICNRLSGAGVYLLPPIYVGFVAMLFLLCLAPVGAFWLLAAAGALAGAMGICSLVFYVASVPQVAPLQPANTRATTSHGTDRPMQQRFVQMTTRTCSQHCAGTDGARTRFTVSCFHAHCHAGGARKETA